MEEQTVRQLHGASDLLHDAVTHGSSAIQRAHEQTAHVPYAILKQVRPIAVPVRLVERMQYEITVVAYGAVRGITRIVASASHKVIQHYAEQSAGQDV